MAQSFARLGSKVTLVAERLLPESDPEVSPLLEQVFRAEGIDIIKGQVVGVERGTKQGHHVAICKSKDNNNNDVTRVQGDQLLLAVGRIPNVQHMGVEAVGIQLNEQTGGIQVNRQLQTSVKNVYAAGDCTGDRQLYVIQIPNRGSYM